MESSSTSAAWLDINKAWESVAELKYELQKTEMKLKEASRPYWRSNENFSKLEELKPSKLRIVDASLINKDIENVYNHKSNTNSTKFQFDFKTVAKSETDSLKDVNNKGPLHSWENLARFHENKTRIVPEFKKQPVEMLPFSINKSNYENTEIDASVLDTKIRYINDHITLPVSKADTLNKKHPEWIKSTSKVPSQQGLQKIREVVEKQKQQLQIKSFQMETRIKSNENIKQPLDTVSKEKEDKSKNAIHISCDKILSTTVDPEKSPNRKTVTASLPLSYKGFAHFGDKINKVKDEIHHAKPIKSAQKQKMKRIKRIVNSSDKRAFITPSCWREAQELIRKKLGPFSTEISDSESKKLSSNKTESCSKQECIISDSDDLLDIIEKTDEKMEEQNLDINKQSNIEQNNFDDDKVISEDVNWKEGEMNEQKQFSLKRITRRKRKTKQKEEKNISTAKVRHYDPHAIRRYIAKQKLERQKKRKEEKQKQLLEKQHKEQRLQDLYAFQKQVFSNYPIATRGTTSIANNKSKQFTEHIYLDLMLSEDKSVSTVSSQLVNLNSKKSKFKQLEEKQFDVNATKNTQAEIPNNNLESLAKNVLSTDKLSSLESSINTDEDIGNNYVQITHINCDINKKIPPSGKSAEDEIDFTGNDYIQETEINSNTNKEIISSEKSIQDNIVSDERLTMLKAFATSIQNQIDLETERIKGLLFQKAIIQTSNPAISEIHQDVGKSDQQFVAESSKKKSEENYKILPGVQNVHSHVLEVIEKKKTVAAIKIQSVYRGYMARKAYKEMKNILDNLNKVNESLSEGPLESEEDIKTPQSILNKTDTEEEVKDLEVINQPEINQPLEIQTETHSQHSDNVESFHYSSDFISIKEDVSAHSDLPSVLSINSSRKIELNSKSDQSTLKNSISESLLMENKENMSDANDEIISVQSENSKTDSNESKPCSEILSEIISHKETTEHELNSNISTSLSEGPLSSIHESEINYSDYLEKNDKEDSYSDSEKSSAVDSYNKSDNIEQAFSNILDTVTGKTFEKTISSNVIENKSVKTETVQTASNFSNYSYESSLSGSEKEVKDSVSDEEENSNTIKRSIEEKSTSISDYSLSNGSEVSNPSILRENENLSNIQLSTVSKVIETEIPEVVGTCISAELSCLETLNNSLLYLNDYRQLNELISHQKDVLNFAHILQLQGDKQQEQQQRMFQALLHQQENQTRLLEESRAEQRQLIQNTIAEAHAAISEKTLKIVEAQAQAVKSSADALLQLTENHHAAKKEFSSEYNNDFEQVETSNHHQSSGKSSDISSQSNLQSSNSSISEDLTVLSEKQNDTFSGNSNIESQSRSKNNELSKYTLSQLSKNTIEESVPESLEQGSITDEQKASISNPVHTCHEDHNLTNKSVQVPSISSHNQICKSVSTISDMGSLFSINQFSPNVDEHFNGELQSLVSSDSFTKFTLDMVNQLTQEEKLRNRHQLARLRLQEKELMEKTKAELSCLELLKKRLRQKGALEKVPSVRKRQRALLLQLHQERAQLRWLQEIHRNSLRKISRKEQRKLHTKETQNVPLAIVQHSQSQDSKSLMSSTTDSVPSEIEAKSTVDSDSHSEIPSVISSVYSSSDSANKNTEGAKSKISSKSSNSHVSTDIQSCKHSNQSLESLLQRFKKLENSKRYLTKREQKLLERRQEVENLLIWKQKLDAEENEIRGIEKKII
ncbi:centrosome-associated protein 350-like [Centruroides vittatus]|uniref:centrosome-associated protein 350-like n=1 Tax=Centruroides vittatus TaxID=120091 RepID=UPI0035106EF0